MCKNRRLVRAGKGCQNSFMRREKLEPVLDSLFADRLTDRRFLETLIEQLMSDRGHDCQANTARLQGELQAISAKRDRILNAYFAGHINETERDRRLAALQRDELLYREMLMREAPTMPLAASELAQVFAPFHEWRFLSREHKRRLLSAVVPEIHVDSYDVNGLSLLTDTLCCGNERSPTGRGSWQRRA